MHYRIDFDKRFGLEIRRILAEQIEDATQHVEAMPDGPERAVHAARKCIKRARALLRFVASCSGKAGRQEENRLAVIGRRLSPLRDASAMMECARRLAGSVADEAMREAVEALAIRLGTTTAADVEFAVALAEASDGFRKCHDVLSDLALSGGGASAHSCLAKGWEKTGRNARKALKRCREGGNRTAYHDLRKRTQDRWMQAMLLHGAWPSAMTAIHKQARTLVDVLGQENDLAILDTHVAGLMEREGHGEHDDTVVLAIHERRLALQRTARDLAEHLYAGKPRHDAAMIGLIVGGVR